MSNDNDEFKDYREGLDSPVDNWFAITPADFDTDLPKVTRGIYINTDGVLVITDKEGNKLSFNVLAGQGFLPVRACQVNAGTTAEVIGAY